MDQSTQNSSYDAIIIGSGMGGMACGSALAHYGKKVLIIEKHYVAGGMTHTFKRKKHYTWDVGVHALGEMAENRLPGKMISWLSQGKVKMNKYGGVYDTFFFPENFKFELPSSVQEYKDNLYKAFPEEKEAIERYFEMVQAAGKSAKMHFFCRNMSKWAETLTSPFLKGKLTNWINLTTKEVLDELTSNPKLKAVLAGQWGYYGSPPSRSSFFIHAVTIRHFWEGAYYPEGTSKTLAENILEIVHQKGGDVLLKTEVNEVLTEGKKAVGVRTNKGEEIFAPIVISAAGARATVERFLPQQEKQKPWAKNIRKLTQSPCHLCVYIGFEGDIKSAGATESNQWFFSNWDQEITLWNYDDKDEKPHILYVSFPSLKDPSHNPGDEKRHTGEVVTFVDWDTFKKWEDTRQGRRGDDYKDLKEELTKRIMDHFYQYLPGLAEMVRYIELSTPLSTTHFCSPPRGAIYGLEPTPDRFNCKDLRPQTPLKNFYLTGADVGTLGVVGALMGGVLTAAKVDKRILSKITGK
ncbi:MAG: NAD(P)/FAD-dependent oxidoreductase [Bdellovibrionota bacterium]|nr:NAD(P)/FAD-dependent oxidoreductase [Bdellovibrionota bacterium]